MMGLGSGLPRTLCRSLFLLLSLATIIVGTSGQAVQSCAANLVAPSNLGVSVQFCHRISVVGASAPYTLWYKLDNSTSPNALSVILSVPRQSEGQWYGMGFNPQSSRMPGTDAIIFWLSASTFQPVVGTYYLTQSDVSGVTPDSTRLKFSKDKEPTVTVEANDLYLSFEVLDDSPPSFANQNFVAGGLSDIPPGSVITSAQQPHGTPSSVQINFISGAAVSTTSDIDSRRRTHGILNIVGWGVLLPLGAIVARYARAFDPHWFYIHAGSQIAGYSLVVAGLITGSKLFDDLPGIDAKKHRALGITLFVLASIQISAVLIRPKKEAKLRRYWNWGHWWSGRVALVMAAVNIFVGIHLASASNKWKVGYGVVLALEILAVIILEILLWLNYGSSKREPSLPQTAMQNRDSNGTSAPPPTYETNWDSKP